MNMFPGKVVLVVGVVMSLALMSTPVSSKAVIFPVSGCTDGLSECPAMADKGLCENSPYRTQVMSFCKLSCNVCTPTVSQAYGAPAASQHSPSITGPKVEKNHPRRSIVNPDFECGGAHLSADQSFTTSDATPQEPQGQEDYTFEAINPDAGVQTIKEVSCGASVIHERYLVTSAYCVRDGPPETVTLGDIDLARENEPNSRPASYSIIEIIRPKTYNESLRYDDIALLKTDRKIEFNEAVFPYCVSANPPLNDEEVIVAGFGFVNETHKTTHLMEGTLRILPIANCEQRYLQEEEERLRKAYPNLLQGRKGLLCAGDKETGVCMNDEGGPLFREDRQTGRRYLDGITSFTGSNCGDGILPGVFTSMADYVDFIDETIYGEEQQP